MLAHGRNVPLARADDWVQPTGENTRAATIPTPALRVWKILPGCAGLCHISDPDVLALLVVVYLSLRPHI